MYVRKKVKKWLSVMLILVFVLSLLPVIQQPVSAQTVLMGHWKFNGNAEDSSGNLRNGIVSDTGVTVIDGDGVDGQCYAFHNGYVQLPINPEAELTDDFTYMLWAKPIDAGKFRNIMGSGNASASTGWIVKTAGGNNIKAPIYDPSNLMSTVYKMEDRKWYHIAVVHDGTAKKMKLYVNGVLDDEVSLAGASKKAWGDAMYVGVRLPDGGGKWSGHIDDVRIYNGVLGSEEIENIVKNSGLAYEIIQTGQLVGHWEMSEQQDAQGKIGDSSNQGHHGTVHGALWQKAGIKNGCFRFDGQDDYIALPDVLGQDSKGFTIATWIYPEDNREGSILSQEGLDWLYRDAAGYIVCDLAGEAALKSNAAAADKMWHHVVLRYDGQKTGMYIDGELAGEITAAPSAFSGAFTVGNSLDRGAWLGSIDDLSIYNYALGEKRINKMAWEWDPSSYPKYMPVIVNPELPSEVRKNIKLDGVFGFKDDPGDQGEREKWYEGTTVFSKEIAVPGNLMAAGYREDLSRIPAADPRLKEIKANPYPPSWYKKTFNIPVDWDADHPIFIKFGGVLPAAKIWINGEYVGYHKGAFVPFAYDITDIARIGQENTLVVKIDEDFFARVMGSGYNRMSFFSGLFRSVEVEQTAKVRIQRFFMKPDIDNQKAAVKVWVENLDTTDRDIALQVKVKDNGVDFKSASSNASVPAGSVAEVTFEVDMAGAELWHPEHPKLYEAEIVIEGQGEEDALRDYFGMRKLSTAQGKLYVNNELFYVRGTGFLNVHPNSLSPETDRNVIRRNLQQLKNYGYNYIRLHSTIPVPEFLDVADELGLFIQQEAGIIGTYYKKNPYSEAVRRDMWDHIIRRDLNSPSKMVTSMGNEQTAADVHPIMKYAYDTAKAFDDTRFIMSSSGGPNSPAVRKWCDVVTHNSDVENIPCFRHEYGHWSAYPDIRLEEKYRNSPLTPWQINYAKASAAESGLTDWLPMFAEKSRELQKMTRKYGIEWYRTAYDTMDGYIMWLAQDTGLLGMGILDDFFDPTNTTAEEFLKSNGETVLLPVSMYHERQFFSKGAFAESIYIHHTGLQDITGGRLDWVFKEEDTGAVVSSGSAENISLKNGDLTQLAKVSLTLPEVTAGKRYKLVAEFTSASVNIDNEWLYWVYPDTYMSHPDKKIVVDIKDAGLSEQIKSKYPFVTPGPPSAQDIFITDHQSAVLDSHINSGGKAFIFARGVYEEREKDWGFSQTPRRVPRKWATYMTTSGFYAGRSTWGEVIDGTHPAMKNIPHEGYMDFGLVDLIHNAHTSAKPEGCTAVYLDADQWKTYNVTPIIRVLDYWRTIEASEDGTVPEKKANRPLAYLFEAQKGQGTLMVSSLYYNLDRPESAYMFDQLLQYMLTENTGS